MNNKFNIINSNEEDILLISFENGTNIQNAYIKDNKVYVNDKELKLNDTTKELLKKRNNIYLEVNGKEDLFILKLQGKILNKFFNKTKKK